MVPVFRDLAGHPSDYPAAVLATRGIIAGYGNGIYDPEGLVTLGDFSHMMYTGPAKRSRY